MICYEKIHGFKTLKPFTGKKIDHSSKQPVPSHYGPTSETQFKWCFTGGPIAGPALVSDLPNWLKRIMIGWQGWFSVFRRAHAPDHLKTKLKGQGGSLT